jgi:hypothetical protein
MTTCRRPGVVGGAGGDRRAGRALRGPDAPRGTFTHWVLAGLEPTATGLAEEEHPAAAVEGRNDFGEEGYSGTLVGTYQR